MVSSALSAPCSYPRSAALLLSRRCELIALCWAVVCQPSFFVLPLLRESWSPFAQSFSSATTSTIDRIRFSFISLRFFFAAHSTFPSSPLSPSFRLARIAPTLRLFEHPLQCVRAAAAAVAATALVPSGQTLSKLNLMSEPEAELQATANLSPVSPSPVHSAASQVVPALQDTVDNLDAMVAAAAAAAASSGVDDSTRPVDPVVGPDDNDDIVDDDSFNDAYGEDTSEPAPQPQLHQQEQVDDNDDYAKTFDSPIGPEEGEEEEFQPEDVSMPRESNDITHITDHLTSRLSEASRVPEPSSSSTAQPQGASASPITTSKPNPDGVVQMVQATQPSIPGQAGLHPTPSALSINAGSNDYSDSPNPSTDIQRLVADFTTQSAEPSSNLDASASFAGAEQPAGSSTLPSALPSASLPPRPPLPHSASQSYAAQHHPSGPNTSIPVSVVAPATPGQPSNFVVAGAPGTSTDTLSSLPPPPLAGLNAPVTIASLNPPSYPSHPPAYATDRSQETEYQRQWDQFMADERQYMSEAKWDRFPEGSRIFIGTRSTSGASKNGAHIFCTGNLSSDKVSKRDVFDLFHRFGRLAQISLKSAYGFVQYHTIEEGRRAMEHLQGIEIKGRRIRESFLTVMLCLGSSV